MTAEEVRREYVTVMGDELGAFFYAFRNELIWLHAKWEQHNELFAGSKERIAFLNDCAAFFFFVVQDALWDDVLLHISRLTDEAESGHRRKRTNLTVRRLPAMVVGTSIHQRIRELVTTAVKAATFIEDWRNRGMAHRDLDLAVADNDVARLVSRGSRKQVNDALAALREVFECIEQHYLRSTTLMELHPSHGAGALLTHLAYGREALEARHRRLIEGRPLPEDGDLPQVP